MAELPVVWLPVVGYEKQYEVSNHGQVRSTSRAHILKPDVHPRDGYLRVGLYKGGKARKFLVHRLVLEAFVGPCPSGLECAHEDGDPANNRLGNFRWDTRVNNFADRDRHGTTARGERQGSSKLTESDVREMRRLYDSGVAQTKLASEFGVSQARVSKIVRKEGWSHVGG